MTFPSPIDEIVLKRRFAELAAARDWEPEVLSKLET